MQLRPNNFQFTCRGIFYKALRPQISKETKRLQPKSKKITGGVGLWRGGGSPFFTSNLDQQPFEETFTKELKSFDQITNLKK